MHKIQEPVVAGQFYPNDPQELTATIKDFFAKAKGKDKPIPKAIVAPHAGYIYSGSIAASAYACLANAPEKIKQVIVAAPSHRYPVRGIAIPSADAFLTPLGSIEVDKKALAEISALPFVELNDAAFGEEHSLEVQLPFLQAQLGDFNLIPLLVGAADIDEVAQALTQLWGTNETLIVISSDLSHYLDYQTAQKIDQKTSQSILAFDYAAIYPEQACGYAALRGLLKIAAAKGLRAELIDLRNSGDTAGSKDQVVGYGAFHFYAD